MALDKPYKDIPGTTIFDAEQARKGYQINQLCMSFMKPENRERNLADREAYLDEWQLTPKARQAILDLDLNEAKLLLPSLERSVDLSPRNLEAAS